MIIEAKSGLDHLLDGDTYLGKMALLMYYLLLLRNAIDFCHLPALPSMTEKAPFATSLVFAFRE